MYQVFILHELTHSQTTPKFKKHFPHIKKYSSESFINENPKMYRLNQYNKTFPQSQIFAHTMPKRQSLAAIVPNRFYEIDATLKYQHIGQNSITGIIEQNDVQTKICIPKDGIQLEQGKQYTFSKCFNSKNGWLYAKNPSQTVSEKQQSRSDHKFFSLKDIYQGKHKVGTHYINTQLKVISIEAREEIQIKGQTLSLYKMKCYSDSLIVNVQLWNHKIDQKVVNKVLNFIGFKIKTSSHQTMTLLSTVYSKLEQESQIDLKNIQKFNFQHNQLYTNISFIYQVRNINQVHKACEMFHKNFSLCAVTVDSIEEFTYEGCATCKKKTGKNGCNQCGSNINKSNCHYLRVILKDQTGFIECAIFQEQAQSKIKSLQTGTKFVFKIKSIAKRNPQTGQICLSHIANDAKSSLTE